MIRLIVMDVDGTLTDGGMIVGEHDEYKKFNGKDGLGIRMAHDRGLETMFLTGSPAACVGVRAAQLGVKYVVGGQRDKGPFLEEFLREHGYTLAEVAYIGDDLNDLDCLKMVGLSGCPNDSVAQVRGIASYVCRQNGGYGAVREFIEHILALED